MNPCVEYAFEYAVPWFWGSTVTVALIQRFAFNQRWPQVLLSLVGLGEDGSPLWFEVCSVLAVIGGTFGLVVYFWDQCSKG